MTTDNLTEQPTNALGQNCSTFTAIGGANVAVFGVLANGEPIETVRRILTMPLARSRPTSGPSSSTTTRCLQ